MPDRAEGFIALYPRKWVNRPVRVHELELPFCHTAWWRRVRKLLLGMMS